MSDYDYEEEPVYEGETNKSPIDTSGVTITLPECVLDSLLSSAGHTIHNHLIGRVDALVRSRVDAIVTETFDRSVAEIAEKAVADFLTKPRQKTNTWGEVMPGASTTMSDLIPAKVESWLKEKVDHSGNPTTGFGRDGYPTRFEHILNKHVRDELTAETKAAAAKVTEEAKKVVSASVGRFIADQLVPQIDVMRKV